MVFFKRKKTVGNKETGEVFFAETVELLQGSMSHADRYQLTITSAITFLENLCIL
jgi:hypothetical protein